MKKLLNLFLFCLLFMQIAFTQGWETLYTLPDAVKGATSTASDGYGVHLVGVYNNVIKHFWVGNDNTVVWSTFAVTGGLMPQVTLYDGILRVTLKIIVNNEQRIRIYQSEDGGYSWTQLSTDYLPVGQPPIYNLYAYSDGYGTHITWDDHPEYGYPNNNEVYYVRYNPVTPGFVNFKNLTDLSSPTYGHRPKVAVAGNKASILFIDDYSYTITSRDLNLDTDQWDSFYRYSLNNMITVSPTSIGDMLFAIAQSDIVVGSDPGPFLELIFRDKDASTWTSGNFHNSTTGFNFRNTFISSGGLLYLIEYDYLVGTVAHTYDPVSETWGNPEIVKSYTGNEIMGSFMIAGGQYGMYYFLSEWDNYPSINQYMRRKASVPNVNINAPVLNGWNMSSIPVALYNLLDDQVYPMRTVNTSVFAFINGYNVYVDALTTNQGYWVKFPSSQTITYSGARTDSMSMPASTGWNLIGSISSTVQTSAITTVPPGILTGSYFKYNGGYQVTTTIAPGQGTWVQTTQNGRIIIKQDGLSKDGENEFDTYDKFIITDSNGNQQELFVRNSNLVGTTESIEMPPVFEQAYFDSRFSSNDIVRTVDPIHGTVDLSIDINEALYPVTLTWEINPENGITYSFNGNGLGKIASGGNLVINNGQKRIQLFGKTTSGSASPNNFELFQNYPNPFNPLTNISYSIKVDGQVTLKVYDILGTEVAQIVNERNSAGNYSVIFDASNLPSGIYLYELRSDGFVQTKKMILMK